MQWYGTKWNWGMFRVSAAVRERTAQQNRAELTGLFGARNEWLKGSCGEPEEQGDQIFEQRRERAQKI